MKPIISKLIQLLTLISVFSPLVLAKRSLSATSLVECSDNSEISPSYFNVTFNPDDRSLRYSLDLTSDISSYVTAHLQVYAYGFLIIEKDIDMCSLGWKQFCPVYPGPLQIDSIEYISEEYTKQIPGIAYQVPDIDAVVKVLVKDRDSQETLACIQSSFSNGKTISQTGVKWATAVVAGLGLLLAALLSTFGNSNAASHISANSVSLFLYFQSVVVVSMQSVERVPPIASAWSENLAWSMGLIKVQFMQDIFRWYVQATGGTPTTYFKGVTQQILVQKRNLQSMVMDAMTRSDLVKRTVDFTLKSNKNLTILRGIKRIGFNSGIEPTSIVATGFTFFVIIGYLLVVVLVLTKSIIILLSRFNKINPKSFSLFRTHFNSMIKGTLLRYISIGFTQLTLFSLWEFVQQDSPAVIVIAVLFIILMISVLSWSYYNVLKLGKESQRLYHNPAALLYGDSHILHKFGFCYTMFNAKNYYFGMILAGYTLLKSIFIAFTQSSGRVSVLPIFIFDLAYTVYLIYSAPYLNKPTNVINYMISIVVTINSFLFLFFSDLFGLQASVASIMGWIFFILNAAFSLILLALVVVFIVYCLVSKNPDARFAPVQDDRFSFQRKASVHRTVRSKVLPEKNQTNEEGELAALGVTAQDHSVDWESEMYKLHNVTGDEANTSEEILTTNSLRDSSNPESDGGPSRFGSLKQKFMNRVGIKKEENPKPVDESSPIKENEVDSDILSALQGHKKTVSNTSSNYASPTDADRVV
ncbi:putative flavin carrier protein 3 [Spathaspora sp. JA1]|nr:putative flavin carrier protein 3 [Spathaspora sp. JA1]